MHSLLERQLRRHIGPVDAIPEEWKRFLDAVDEAYYQTDDDRDMLERSLELTSQELMERNRQLRQQVKTEHERTELIEMQSQALLEVLQSVAQGDLDVKIDVPEGVEVLSELSAGVEMMIDDLQKLLDEQEQARAEAEEAQRQLETALEEVIAVQRRYVQQEWRGFTTTSGASRGYAISALDNTAGPTTDAWLPGMTSAVQQVDTVVEEGEQRESTLAVPMHMYGEVVGVLGVSREGATWSNDEIAIVEAIVEQMALALENLRLFEQTQTALEEVEATHRRYIGRAWTEYVHAKETSGYEQRDVIDIEPLGGEVLPEVQQVMLERGTVILGDDDSDSSVLVTPIMVRGQPIGALGFRANKAEREWNADDIAMAEAIGEQLGLAAENLRLLDETQRRAAREHALGGIADRMQRAADMEALMRITAEELNRALGGSRAYVRLTGDMVDGGQTKE